MTSLTHLAVSFMLPLALVGWLCYLIVVHPQAAGLL